MTEFLFNYGYFLAKTITLIVGFLITCMALISITMRAKAQEGTFLIENINDRLQDIQELLEEETLPKKVRKEQRKQRKAEQKKALDPASKPRLFILSFEGDTKASQVADLRESITALITIIEPKDEVLLLLESGGGYVPHYGLAASQLVRLRERHIPLTIAVDKIAASGGYLMACVANQLIAAPFAIIGSIGVVAEFPNFNRFLEKHDIDYEQLTAGHYKRTLSIFGKNTDQARKKVKEELNQMHQLFQEFIHTYRSHVDLAKTTTGEYWYGKKALDLDLVDQIESSDDYILKKASDYQIFTIAYHTKLSFKDKLNHLISANLQKLFTSIFPNFHSSL